FFFLECSSVRKLAKWLGVVVGIDRFHDSPRDIMLETARRFLCAGAHLNDGLMGVLGAWCLAVPGKGMLEWDGG
ncbi:hypothetical protein HOY82DRAFT_484059, partial [Tuber indicum]